MNVSKNDIRLYVSSVPSRLHATNSRVNNLICAAVLASLVMFTGAAKSANVLLNPGAEAGSLTNWNASLTGYIYVVSTNTQVGGQNILAHSGSNVFQLFNTTGNSSYLYQDIAAAAGSQWSASCYAICLASDYFSSGANAHMQIVFYDLSNNVVPYPGAAGGVFGTVFLDPIDYSGLGVTWTIVPPMAVDASGWMSLQATNLYDTDPATEASFDPTTVPAVLTAPPGTALVRYQIEFDNSATGGGSVYWDDCDLEKITGSDPDITNPPVAVTIFAGSSASFTVGAKRAQKPEILTYQWQFNGTNLPPVGGVNGIFGGTTNATLSLVNCQQSAAGLYSVMVTDISTNTPPVTNSIRSVPVPLTVLTLSPLQKANVLGANSGFEGNPAWPVWEPFNGAYFATTNAFYDAGATVPVNVLDGNSVALIGANGDRDNGIHHSFAAAPGSIWKAGGWTYISSANDFVAGNTCRVQIWFLNSVGGAVTGGTPTYESFKLYGLGYTNVDAQYTNIDTSSPNFGQVGYHAQLPRDQWIFLPVTNVVNNGGIGLGDDLPYNTLTNGYFMVPANSAAINFQVYEYCPVANDNPQADLGGSGADATYWDDMLLIQVLPVTDLKASVGSNNVNLSFSAGAGLSYAVLYKTNLADATWNVLTNVAAPNSWATNPASIGTTYPLTVSDPATAHSRFYRVLSQ
jgi:hypothetical protein